MTENSLVLIEKASLMLAEANTIQQTKELKDLMLTAADWAKRRGMGEETIQRAREYSLLAERKMGELLRETEPERAKGGEQYHKTPTGTVEEPVPTLSNLGITKKESSQAKFLADLPDEKFEEIRTGKASIPDARREVRRKEIIEHLENIETKQVKAIEGVYDVIIVDPPWPMRRIELESRPNAVAMPYPIMSLEEIKKLKIPCAENCHVWLWATQRFLPEAFHILEIWGLTYICTFVWHKDNAYQPLGLPKYNAEFALYARNGIPKFIDTKSFWLCFNGKSGKHSEKPTEFYNTIQRVTAGRRLDMFSRREIKGFDGWGKEAK